MTHQHAIIFVYNADTGVFNLLTDIAHKTLSPSTYTCNLCKLTHAPLRMRARWKTFLESLDHPLEFLHRDEFRAAHGADLELPAILLRSDEGLRVLLDAPTLDGLESMDELRERLLAALSA